MSEFRIVYNDETFSINIYFEFTKEIHYRKLMKYSKSIKRRYNCYNVYKITT